MGKTGFWVLIAVHLIGVLIMSVLLLWLKYPQAWSFAFGGLATAINFYTLAIVLKAIAAEKSVAWAILLVVFKYAIFGYFIYYLVERKSIDLLAFGLGVGSLAITAPIAAILILKLAKGKNGSL
jgi:predicted permease